MEQRDNQSFVVNSSTSVVDRELVVELVRDSRSTKAFFTVMALGVHFLAGYFVLGPLLMEVL